LFAAPSQPFAHCGAAGVPGVDRRSAPEGFQRVADFAAADGGQRAAGSGNGVGGAAVEAVDGFDDGDAVGAAGVRGADRVQELLGRCPQGPRCGGPDPGVGEEAVTSRKRGD
jgi:hypothetical protein